MEIYINNFFFVIKREILIRLPRGRQLKLFVNIKLFSFRSQLPHQMVDEIGLRLPMLFFCSVLESQENYRGKS